MQNNKMLQEGYFSNPDTDDDVVVEFPEDSNEQGIQTDEMFRSYKYSARVNVIFKTSSIKRSGYGTWRSFTNAVEDYIFPLIDNYRIISSYGFFISNILIEKNKVFDFRQFNEYSEYPKTIDVTTHELLLAFNVNGGELVSAESIFKTVAFIYDIMNTIYKNIGCRIFSISNTNSEVTFIRNMNDGRYRQVIVPYSIYNVITSRQYSKSRGQVSRIKDIISTFTSKKGVQAQASQLISQHGDYMSSGSNRNVVVNAFSSNDFNKMKREIITTKDGNHALLLTVPKNKKVYYRSTYSYNISRMYLRVDGELWAMLMVYPDNRYGRNNQWGLSYLEDDYHHNTIDLYPYFISCPIDPEDNRFKTTIDFCDKFIDNVTIYGNDLIFDNIEEFQDYVIIKNAANVKKIRYKLIDFSELEHVN